MLCEANPSIFPPVSAVDDVPPVRTTCPLLPVVVAAFPDVSAMTPAVPELVVPVLNCNLPLTPFVPASADNTMTWPLLFVLPAPVDILIPPPVVLDVVPEENETSPPTF